MSDSSSIAEEEFCKLFVSHMLTISSGKVGDMTRVEVEDYATETAPTYFADPSQREAGPESCAESDFSYWE